MKYLFYNVLAMLLIVGCKEHYDPPYKMPDTGYLVVEGVINSGQGTTTIQLTRTIPLADTATIEYETGAAVSVEGENNSQYVLTEGANGNYSISQLNLSSGVKYRLHIGTRDGKQYYSDYRTIIRTPAIDNVRWEQPNDLELYINTHDPQNNTKYYQWSYKETWEFHSSFLTQLKYLRNNAGLAYAVDYLFPDQHMDASKYTCWQSATSTTLLIGSSAKLSKDSIDLPLLTVPNGSWKASVLYSINVMQHALSKEGYEFLQRMKKNTEQTGTLFDAQPSELKGNIYCTSDASEVVVGFVEVADVVEKRIFIKAGDLKQWKYATGCLEQTVQNVPDSVALYSYLSPTLVAGVDAAGGIDSFFAAPPTCVDCTLRGTNVKPDFWP